MFHGQLDSSRMGKKNFQWGIPKFAIVVKQKCVLSGEYSKFFALQWWQATVVIPYQIKFSHAAMLTNKEGKFPSGIRVQHREVQRDRLIPHGEFCRYWCKVGIAGMNDAW